MKDKPAKREDWKTEPFPELTVNLALERVYSLAEFEQIAQGCVPQQMEDKWFIFYEAPWLFVHRSWTGYCIYQVRFEPVREGMRVAEVRANREPSQHKEREEIRDCAFLAILLDSRVGKDVRQAMLDYLRPPSSQSGGKN